LCTKGEQESRRGQRERVITPPHFFKKGIGAGGEEESTSLLFQADTFVKRHSGETWRLHRVGEIHGGAGSQMRPRGAKVKGNGSGALAHPPLSRGGMFGIQSAQGAESSPMIVCGALCPGLRETCPKAREKKRNECAQRTCLIKNLV